MKALKTGPQWGPFAIALFGAFWINMVWWGLGWEPMISSYMAIQAFVMLYLLMAEAKRMEELGEA